MLNKELIELKETYNDFINKCETKEYCYSLYYDDKENVFIFFKVPSYIQRSIDFVTRIIEKQVFHVGS